MFARNTILARREPFPEPDASADPPIEGDPRYIFNRVRVVGPSPVSYMGGQAAEWQGVGAQGVVIEPIAGFGGNVDRPLGELQHDYVIESEPAATVVAPTVTVINAHTREAGPTPEEVFDQVRGGTNAMAKAAPKRRARAQK